MSEDLIEFKLQPKQEEYCSTSADIAFFGGSAGGGKTWASLMEATRHINVPGFGAIIFRREMTQIKQQGGIWEDAGKIYPLMGARSNLSERYWEFPPHRTRIQMAGLEREDDRFKYQGAAIPVIMFEEVTHFTENQFWYMLSRNRSTCGVKPYIRATCNPDADSWVRRLIDWWIGPDGYALDERSGVIRYFVRINDVIVWGDTREELSKMDGVEAIDVKSFTFIRSKLEDNQALLKVNPEYLGNLKALGRVERERLLDGNWDIRPSAGLYFRREWFNMVDTFPANIPQARSHDLAATTFEEADNPDLTASVKMGRYDDGRYIITDCESDALSPHKVKIMLKRLAQHDGQRCRISIPQDPAQAGKAQARELISFLAGYNVKAIPRNRSTGNKLAWASPFSAQVEAGNVDILRGPWNEAFFNILENFPEGGKDDEVDAAADAFHMLSTNNRELKIA